MQLPQLKIIKKSTSVNEEFLGYNANRRISEQEFRDELNMSSCEYPVLRPRDKRYKSKAFSVEFDNDGGYRDKTIYEYEHATLCAADKIAFLIDGNLFYDNVLVSENFGSGKGDQLIYMNGKLITFPAGRVYDVETKMTYDIEVSQTVSPYKIQSFNARFKWEGQTETVSAFDPKRSRKIIVKMKYYDMIDPDNDTINGGMDIFNAFSMGLDVSEVNVESCETDYFTVKSAIFQGIEGDDTIRLQLDVRTTKKLKTNKRLDIKLVASASGSGVGEDAAYVKAFLCKSDNYQAITNYKESETAPVDPADGDYWMDISNESATLKSWSAQSSMWVQVLTAYYKIQLVNGTLIDKFQKGDTVELVTSCKDLEGQWDIYDKGSNFIVINAVLRKDKYDIYDEFTIRRNCPKLNYICTMDNRVWGVDVEANEIHASALGDPLNWEQDSEGLSTDSYVVKVASEGAFTGIAYWNGYVLCFKENYIHKIYGTKPTNYSIKTFRCDGVQEGSNFSLATVDGVLFYKGIHGVYAYEGNLPYLVSKQFGDERYTGGYGGAYNGRYYIVFNEASFCYDVRYGIWHKEERKDIRSNIIDHYQDAYYLTLEDEVIDHTTGTKVIDYTDIGKSAVVNTDNTVTVTLDVHMLKGVTYTIKSEYDWINLKLRDMNGSISTISSSAVNEKSYTPTKDIAAVIATYKVLYYKALLTTPGLFVDGKFVYSRFIRGDLNEVNQFIWTEVVDGVSKRHIIEFENPEESIANGDIDAVTLYGTQYTGQSYRFDPETRSMVLVTEGSCKRSFVPFLSLTQANQTIDVVSRISYLNTMDDHGDSLQEPDFNWFAETGEIGLSLPGKKWVSRILIRASIPEGASLKVFSEYDSSGNWHMDYSRKGLKSLNTIVMPIVPRRCDHMRLRFEGIGDVCIYSVSKEIEMGSEM